MFDRNRAFRNAAFLLLMAFLAGVIACNTTSQFDPTPIMATQTALENPAPITDSFVPGDPPATPLGTDRAEPFVPGDPTATPLGTDITDPNFIQGLAAYDAKSYEETVSLMSRVIQSNPTLAPPYRYRGLAYYLLNDCNSAMNDFDHALSINREYAAAWAGRGLVNSCLGDESQALQDYQKALAIDPSLAFVHHNLGVYNYSLGNYELALEEFSLSVAIDPGRSGAWVGSAEALLQMGRYQECITNATRAIEVKLEEWSAYNTRAFCERDSGDFLAAAADYQTFIEHDASADAEAWYNLGYAQFKAGLHQDAVISYSKTLEMDPDYYPAYINRGLEYVQLERYDEALDDYNRALEFGDIPFAYSGRGDAYFGLKMYDRAIADFEKAISLMQGSPSSAHSYCMVALSYFEVGRYQDTIDAAEISNGLDPFCGGQRLFEYQGRSHYALGDPEQGILYMTKALHMGGFSMGFYYRGIMYHDTGEYEKASSDLNRFLATVQSPDVYKKEIADAKTRLAELTP
jgi:tetratricopeptide (TPR) repeat protein